MTLLDTPTRAARARGHLLALVNVSICGAAEEHIREFFPCAIGAHLLTFYLIQLQWMLRRMDLRYLHLSPQVVEDVRGLFMYQPFILSDEVQSGIAYDWSHGGGIYQIERSKVDGEVWEAFGAANQDLRLAYDGWLDTIAAMYGDMAGASVVDTACAEGYFLHGLEARGAAQCIGYDLSERVIDTNRFLNEVLGHSVDARAVPYDMQTHSIPSVVPADIVISSAIMVHLSDPTYYLNFLGSITKKLLFLYSAFEDTEEFRITFERPRAYHDIDAKFPLCFSGRTTISSGLLKFALAEMGFTTVAEMQGAVPLATHGYRAFVAMRP